MTLLLSFVFAAILGACLGSFANVLAIRWHLSSTLIDRSRCPACRKPIRARHLVPVLSWLLLRGRCADCKKPIHFQYPLGEFIAAFLAVIVAFRHPPFDGQMGWFLLELLLLVSLLVMCLMDFRWRELPVEFMAGVAVCAFLVRMALAIQTNTIPTAILSLGMALLVVLLIFGSQWLISRGRWLGSGDVLFALMMATILSWPLTLTAIYITYIIGGIFAAVVILTHTLHPKARIPFAPILSIGLVLTLWFGPAIQSIIERMFF